MNTKKWFWLVVLLLGFVFLFKFVLKTKETNQQTQEITPTLVNINLFTVDRVVDGDTIIVEYNGKKEYVRLIGIDSPEENTECYATEATNRTKELIENKKVMLNSDSSQNDLDKYGRLLRYVRLTDGTFINQKLIEEGYAKEYTYKVAYQYQEAFRQAEKEAKNNQKGIWGLCN